MAPLPETTARLTFTAETDSIVMTYGMLAGGVKHDYLASAKLALRRNMWAFAPEANFYDPERPGEVRVSDAGLARVPGRDLALKSCNRCGRFLPINLDNERDHLSFSNHCVAAHRRPCSHTGFGKITDRDTEAYAKPFIFKVDDLGSCRSAGVPQDRERGFCITLTGTVYQLEYGFQLECRFCKKFEVNAAHNPQRTAGQMKEDAARRRHF